MASCSQQSEKRPNILIIVADDLGFSDTSPYGGEISTPNLMKLAKSGVRLTDFHTAPACSPTRSMLFSASDSHLAGLGQMAEYMARQGDRYRNRPGYEGYLNFRVAALSEILQDAGYLTMMAGKWHLGMKAELAPAARDDSFPKLPMIKSDGFWMEGNKFIDRKQDLPADFYSSKYFANRLMGFLDERTSSEKEKPFFAYLALTAPHWPLQAPQETIKKYRGKYDDGPNALRSRRVDQLQRLGLVPTDIEPAPIHAGTKDWDEMTKEEKAVSARRMEVYAAMVDELDCHVGSLLDKLESTGELDNTLVIFMSDNDAEGALMEAMPISKGMQLSEIINEYYDNSLDNIGNPTSFVWYGPRWAMAATAPSRGFKGMTTEGGIRCPCIVRYPGLIGSSGGGINHNFMTVMDILPTCLELAGIPQPNGIFRGREVVPIRGKSWVPHLSSKKLEVHDSKTDIMAWELFGVQAIRRGNFKAVSMEPSTAKWQLYDLSKDPGEIHDLAGKEPQILSDLILEWEKFYAETGMFDDKAMSYIFR